MEHIALLVRLTHIICGVFWAGAAMMLAGFIEPTVRYLGSDGGKFMQRFMGASRFPVVMSLAAFGAVLSGGIMFWQVSGGFAPEWMLSRHGVCVTIGSLAGGSVFFIGQFINAPTARRIAELARRTAASGAPPSAEQAKIAARLRKKLRQAGSLSALLLLVSVAAMSAARLL